MQLLRYAEIDAGPSAAAQPVSRFVLAGVLSGVLVWCITRKLEKWFKL